MKPTKESLQPDSLQVWEDLELKLSYRDCYNDSHAVTEIKLKAWRGSQLAWLELAWDNRVSQSLMSSIVNTKIVAKIYKFYPKI